MKNKTTEITKNLSLLSIAVMVISVIVLVSAVTNNEELEAEFNNLTQELNNQGYLLKINEGIYLENEFNNLIQEIDNQGGVR